MSSRNITRKVAELERVLEVNQPFYVLKTVWWEGCSYLVMVKSDIEPHKLRFWRGPFKSRLEANRWVWSDIKCSNQEMRARTLRYYSEEQLQNESGEMMSTAGVWCQREDQAKINKAEMQRLNQMIEKHGRDKVFLQRCEELKRNVESLGD